jgi:alkylation response protein AidB-like acyl-CoA dehydrogenase
MTAELSDSEKALFRESVEKFLAREVTPHYETWEKAEIWPRELWRKFGEAGFLCVDQPVEYGGYGASFEMSCIVIDAVSRSGFAALASGLSVHSDIVAPYVLHLGSEAQKQKILPAMVTGEIVGAIAMTEPGTGSDLQGIRTSAISDGDDFVMNGSKTFITNGQHCDMVIVAARTDPDAGARGISLFTVDCGSAGFQRGRNLEKMGLNAGDTSEMSFSDVRVPADSILGGLGEGFASLMNELPRERLILSVGCVGAADGILEQTVDYVKERRAFGSALSQFQNTRYEMADMKTDIELNRALVEKSIERYMAGDLTSEDASMCKLASSEMQGRVADRCLQLFGGYGYMKEYPIARAYVDARVQRIYGGTSEIMKELIARSVLGR